jgi:ubiquinone/menaquinone biosynthesis C-methylase UbiE
MLKRVLEPEVMDHAVEAREYDLIDHSHVNSLFVRDMSKEWRNLGLPTDSCLVDIGTGTARIPVEVCKQIATCRVVGIDLAYAMLALGYENVVAAGFASRIHVLQADARHLPLPDARAQVVVSNSLLHHLADPFPILRECLRVLDVGGLLFVRDLIRPDCGELLDTLLNRHTAGQSEQQRRLLADSLCASLTVEEVKALALRLPLKSVSVRQTSDRHWTLVGCG